MHVVVDAFEPLIPAAQSRHGFTASGWRSGSASANAAARGSAPRSRPLRKRGEVDLEPAGGDELRDQAAIAIVGCRRRRTSRGLGHAGERGQASAMNGRAHAASSLPSALTRLIVVRFCSGWIPALTISASARAFARR